MESNKLHNEDSESAQKNSEIPSSRDNDENKSEEITTGYISNPFVSTINGLMKILRYNAVVSMLASLLLFAAILLFYVVIFGSFSSKSGPFIVIGFILSIVGWLLIIPFSVGIMTLIAADSIKERRSSFKDILHRTINKIFPILGLVIVYGFCFELGLMLFIIPGVIIFARGSLSFLIMFDEGIGPIKAFNRSFALTKGHTIEMLGSLFAGYLISGGYLLMPATSMAPLVGRYEALKKLEANKGQKPKTHWLNYLSIIVPVLVVIIFVIIITVSVVGAGKSLLGSGNNVNKSSSSAASPVTSPAIDTGPAIKVSDEWLTDIQQNTANDAYNLEGLSYQQKYSEETQLNDFQSIRVPGVTMNIVNTEAGLRSDGKTQFVALVYDFTTTKNLFYVEVYVQNEGGVWQVWGFNSSYTPIIPSIPS